jgi:hypothetical protein
VLSEESDEGLDEVEDMGEARVLNLADDNVKYKLSIQHYVLFKAAIKNQTKLETSRCLCVCVAS